MAVIDWWNGPLTLVFFLCVVLAAACLKYRRYHLSCLPFFAHFLFIVTKAVARGAAGPRGGSSRPTFSAFFFLGSLRQRKRNKKTLWFTHYTACFFEQGRGSIIAFIRFVVDRRWRCLDRQDTHRNEGVPTLGFTPLWHPHCRETWVGCMDCMESFCQQLQKRENMHETGWKCTEQAHSKRRWKFQTEDGLFFYRTRLFHDQCWRQVQQAAFGVNITVFPQREFENVTKPVNRWFQPQWFDLVWSSCQQTVLLHEDVVFLHNAQDVSKYILLHHQTVIADFSLIIINWRLKITWDFNTGQNKYTLNTRNTTQIL